MQNSDGKLNTNAARHRDEEPAPHVAPRPHAATAGAERTISATPGVGHPAPDGNGGRPAGDAHGHHAHAPLVTRLPAPRPHALAGCAQADPLSPAERYAEFFVAVQRSNVFADSKTFPDCVPRRPPDEILAHYRARRDDPGFSLVDFVCENFTMEIVHASHYVSDPASPLLDHINGLWPVLTRQPRDHPAFCSLLPLPKPYVVPGGRFGELYYWDSYFTMLGLAASGRHGLLRAMADNFAYLIDTYGHVPNGTRSYYLSRSQPPVFALMTDLFDAHAVRATPHYLPQLRREHAFWMDGSDSLSLRCAHRRAVRTAAGALLNRYWDDYAHPREEAYAEDIATAGRSTRPCHHVYRDLRAAAESGWDFSSRWLVDPADLATIRTTSLLPVDLNALLWYAETRISKLCETIGDAAAARLYQSMADTRRAAIDGTMWDDAAGAWFDYDWQSDARTRRLTAATAMPLYLGLPDPDRAARVADTIAARLLAPGGIATTEHSSGQQWDRPNGWAPLQWIAVQGLRRYGHTRLADDIASRWLHTVADLYSRECKLVEKYRLNTLGPRVVGGSGGEYPLQDGFGWTNGVAGALLQEYAGHPAAGTCAVKCQNDGDKDSPLQ
uniref:alpha,alpha-trehalase TreF n=1 Tax=Cupriavidus yeoncheonensis TaxID=1462994 RepID=UPI003F4992C4